MHLLRGEAAVRKNHHPILSRTCWKRFSSGHLARSPEIKFYITVRVCVQRGQVQRQLFARGKRFNRKTVSPVKLAYSLSTPRLSVSVLFSLVRQSVLHDKARVCRFAPLAEFLTRKLSTFRCPLASQVIALKIISPRAHASSTRELLRVWIQSHVLISLLWELFMYI